MMRTLFINLTQHSLLPEQKEEAKLLWNSVEFIDARDLKIDLNVDPLAASDEVMVQAESIVSRIRDFIAAQQLAVLSGEPPVGTVVFHIGGEFSLMWMLAHMLLKLQQDFSEIEVVVIISTTKRVSEEIKLPDGSVKKISKFKFIRFREIQDFWEVKK